MLPSSRGVKLMMLFGAVACMALVKFARSIPQLDSSYFGLDFQGLDTHYQELKDAQKALEEAEKKLAPLENLSYQRLAASKGDGTEESATTTGKHGRRLSLRLRGTSDSHFDMTDFKKQVAKAMGIPESLVRIRKTPLPPGNARDVWLDEPNVVAHGAAAAPGAAPGAAPSAAAPGAAPVAAPGKGKGSGGLSPGIDTVARMSKATFHSDQLKEFTTPLYVFESAPDKDGYHDIATCTSKVLLESMPGSRKPYKMLWGGPIAFISPKNISAASESRTRKLGVDSEAGAAHRGLYAYWHEKDREMLTTSKMDEKTRLGLGYGEGKLLGFVGHVPATGHAPGSIGLWQYRNPCEQTPCPVGFVDNAMLPFGTVADVNKILADFADTGGSRIKERAGKWERAKGALLFARLGSCDMCQTTVARTFGNKNGPGCQLNLGNRRAQGFGWSMEDGGRNKMEDGGGNKKLIKALDRAARMIGLNAPRGIRVSPPFAWHMTLLYNCYLTRGQIKMADAALRDRCGKGWENLNPRFKELVYSYNKPSFYSFILRADEATEAILQSYVAGVEACMESKGFDVKCRRAESWAFHVTVGGIWQNGKGYPGQYVANKINKAIDWASITDTTIQTPHWFGRPPRFG